MTDNELVAPRPLNKSDVSHLRTMFELQLHIADEAAEEDAADLIDYALDMVQRGKNVGSVIEELEFMQYEVCDAAVAKKIGKCLISFLREIKREMQGKPNKLDLSTKAASRKPSQEMHQTLYSGSISAAQRSKKGIYNSRGELVKQWKGYKGNEEIDVAAKRRQYFQDLEDARIRQDLRDKRSSLDTEEEVDPYKKETSGVNLSAQSSAMKPYAEIDVLNATAEDRKGTKKAIYDESGNLKSWSDEKEQNEGEMDLSARAAASKHHDEIDSQLDEFRSRNKSGKGVKKQIYNQRGELNAWNNKGDETDSKEMDLSTQGNLKKKAAELDALRATANPKGYKQKIYDESGKLNAWTNLKKEDGVEVNPTRERDVICPIDQSISALGEQKRKEFEAVMKDRSLGREERSMRIEEIKEKYAVAQGNYDPKDRDDGGEMKLSANASSKKHHNELEFLRNRMLRGSVVTAKGQRNAMFSDEGELICDASKNDGGGPRHNSDMDLSTMGNLKKKSQELEALRATGLQRRGVKGRIYDESGQLNAWNKLRKNDVFEVKPPEESVVGPPTEEADSPAQQKRKEIEAVMKDRSLGREERSMRIEEIKEKYAASQGNYYPKDQDDGGEMKLSADSSAKKHHNELEFLRKRMARGSVVTANGQRNAMYSEEGEFVCDANKNEGEQHNHNPDMDLSTQGNLKKKSQELEALRATGAQRRGIKGRIYDESGQLNAWNKLRKNDVVEVKPPEESVAGPPTEEADSPAQQKRKEIEAVMKDRSLGREERSMRIEEIKGKYAASQGNYDPKDQDDVGEMKLSADSSAKKHHNELEFLRNRMLRGSVVTANGQRNAMYSEEGEFVCDANKNEGEQHNHNPDMDLSTQGNLKKKAAELEALRATANPKGYKQKIYDESGQLNAWTNLKKEDEVEVNPTRERDVIRPIDQSAITLGEQKRKEFEAVMKDRSLGREEKSRRIEEIKEKYAAAQGNYDPKDQDDGGEMKLSADSSAKKHHNELEFLRKRMARGSVVTANGQRNAMYSEEGELICDASKNEGGGPRHNPDMDLSTMGFLKKKSQELDALRATGAQRRGVKGRIYDESGQLNAWTSLKDTEETGGVNHKETIALRELTEDETSSLRMMLKVNLKISNDNDEEDASDLLDYALDMIAGSENVGNVMQELVFMEMKVLDSDMVDSFGQCLSTFLLSLGGGATFTMPKRQTTTGMDLSAEGMRRKKAEEIDALRSSGNSHSLKEKMYDSQGNLVGCINNDGEQDRHNLDMDTSAEGMRLKKAREMEALRSTANPQGLKQKMYDESGNLNAWNKLENNDESKLLSNMDLTPNGMKKKKSQEIEVLRSSLGANNPGAQMYDADGNIVHAINNYEEQDRHNSSMDVSAEGMALRKARELEAIRTGAVNHKETIAPRELTKDETSSLRMTLKAKLKIPNDNYEEDAAALLDYALDMITGGENVGNVMQELVFMEMKVLDSDMVDNFGQCLSTFLLSLGGDTTLARRSKTAIYDSNGNIIDKKTETREQVHGSRLDLSTKAAAQRPTKEMQATLLSGSVSAKERSKQDIYDENGMLIKQWSAGSGDDGPAVHGINLSAQAAAKRAANEVDTLLHKKKSGGGLGYRLSKYKEFVKPRVELHHEGDDHDEDRMNSLDLSALAFARKSCQEMKATLLTEETSVKEQSKQGIYDENGVLKKQWANVDIGEIDDIDAHIDEKRKLYFEQLEDEKKLRERISKRDALLAEQRQDPEAYDKNDGPQLKLSALSQARKPQEEVRALRSVSDSEGVKKAIYDENGVLIKQWANFNGDDNQQSVDAQRRGELQSIMNDHSLSKEERAERIEEVKARYAATSNETQGGGTTAPSNAVKAPENPHAEKRNEEFQKIMRDRSLTREQRALKIEEMKKKYSTSPPAVVSSDSPEKSQEASSELDLSALTFARKSSQEMKATLLSSADQSAKERSKQGIYDENGVLIKQWANVKGASSIEEEEDVTFKDDDAGVKGNPSFKELMSKSVDEQRREEMHLIMRDRSLSKTERAELIEQVKERYATSGKSGDAPVENNVGAPPKKATSNILGKSDALDDQRRRELQSIMKNRSIDRATKNKLMEEVKTKYDEENGGEANAHDSIDANIDEENDGTPKVDDSITANHEEEGNGAPNNDHDGPIDLSAASFSQKHLKELEAIKAKTSGESLKEKMATFNNDTTVYYDSVSFAVSQNKSESARQTAKRETVESAKKYNYNYGDGGVVDETSAEFKAIGDDDKAAKKETKKHTSRFHFKLGKPTINCDPLAFAMKNNKSESARRAVKRDTKESSKSYNYKYTG